MTLPALTVDHLSPHRLGGVTMTAMPELRTLDEPEHTLSRSELLKMRGYPAEVVNGHVDNREPPVIVSMAEEAKVCSVCQQPIASERLRRYRRTRTCGEECGRELKRRGKVARRRSSGQQVATPAPASVGTDDTYPDRLVRLVTQLVSAGLMVTLEVDGSRLLVHA